MPRAGFESAIPATKRPQTYALGLATTGIGPGKFYNRPNFAPFILESLVLCRSRVSSFSIVSDYGLDDRSIGIRSPAEAKDFSSNLCVQTGSGAHPASCTMGTGGKSAAGA
jgi:hypothetical protein